MLSARQVPAAQASAVRVRGIGGDREDVGTAVPDIPVAFTSFGIGDTLYEEYQAGTPPPLSLEIHVVIDPTRDDWNVIAESKGGDKNHVVVVDAHLARQRIWFRDDPGRRRADAARQSAEQAAVDLVRR